MIGSNSSNREQGIINNNNKYDKQAKYCSCYQLLFCLQRIIIVSYDDTVSR